MGLLAGVPMGFQHLSHPRRHREHSTEPQKSSRESQATSRCAHCHRLAYDCQRELPHYRALRKGQKLSDRLETGCVDDPVFRPKGMHRKTFKRLERSYYRAVHQMSALADAHFVIST